MKKIATIFTTVIFAVASAFSLIGCGLFDSSDNNDSTDITDNVDVGFSKPLNSKPVAASSSAVPNILDSYTDGKYNYYLLDVGYIENMYISTLAMVEYTGVPISFSKTTTSSSSYISAVTENVMESITVSNSQSYKVGIGVAWESEKFKVGKFSVKGNFEWNGTWTNSATASKSVSSTLETAKKYEESQTISYSFGENSAAHGRYRYAIYSTCDIYFVLKTSVNNDTLHVLDTQICARENDYYMRSEYSQTGSFDNSPVGEININDDFYKSLPIPDSANPGANNENDAVYKATVRTGQITIYNGNNNVIDNVNFNFGYSYEQLKYKGYTKIKISLSADIKEYRTSSDLYNGIQIQDKSGVSVKTWEYKRHRGGWETYQIDVDNLDIDRFYMGENKFKIRLKYYCKNSNFQDWYLGTVKITVTALA